MIIERDVLTPTLDGLYYTDPGILAAEFERIFERAWYYAGRADEIPGPAGSSGGGWAARQSCWYAAGTRRSGGS